MRSAWRAELVVSSKLTSKALKVQVCVEEAETESAPDPGHRRVKGAAHVWNHARTLQLEVLDTGRSCAACSGRTPSLAARQFDLIGQCPLSSNTG